MPEPTGTDADVVEQHRAVDYAIQDFVDTATHCTVRPDSTGQTFTVAGVCPGCGGRTETIWMFGSGDGHKGFFGGRRSATDSTDRRRTVCCDCGHAHANRPADAVFLGCGAYWQVELP